MVCSASGEAIVLDIQFSFSPSSFALDFVSLNVIFWWEHWQPASQQHENHTNYDDDADDDAADDDDDKKTMQEQSQYGLQKREEK